MREECGREGAFAGLPCTRQPDELHGALPFAPHGAGRERHPWVSHVSSASLGERAGRLQVWALGRPGSAYLLAHQLART